MAAFNLPGVHVCCRPLKYDLMLKICRKRTNIYPLYSHLGPPASSAPAVAPRTAGGGRRASSIDSLGPRFPSPAICFAAPANGPFVATGEKDNTVRVLCALSVCCVPTEVRIMRFISRATVAFPHCQCPRRQPSVAKSDKSCQRWL